MEKKSAWTFYSKMELKKVDAYGKAYMDFLNNGKTERECTYYIINEIDFKCTILLYKMKRGISWKGKIRIVILGAEIFINQRS